MSSYQVVGLNMRFFLPLIAEMDCSTKPHEPLVLITEMFGNFDQVCHMCRGLVRLTWRAGVAAGDLD